ncbi:Shikimate 5-dehydrogenase I alpha [invertebrate metagenome]|uniref:shikimate dehydrogenase (NADP(+)) n=1 Tax=invertebrate metagenome TaxID=1711999 RepID=A0A484H7G8_9ZZZZ
MQLHKGTSGTKLAGVIGWPIWHSRSPRLHSWWLKRYGIDGAYVPLAVRPCHFSEVVRALGKAGFQGMNVTVPHKEAALTIVDEATPLARRIGAVNTIVCADGGRLLGANTDSFGFTENLRENRPDWRVCDGPVVVLGAGGAARAIVSALVDGGVQQLFLVNRSYQRAQTLAADIGGPIEIISWSERAKILAGASLLVNTTTLGMMNSQPLEIDLGALPETAVVMDAVYTPLKTHLLAIAAERGNPIVDGIGMLLHQARPSFAAWFSLDPEVTAELRAFMLE